MGNTPIKIQNNGNINPNTNMTQAQQQYYGHNNFAHPVPNAGYGLLGNPYQGVSIGGGYVTNADMDLLSTISAELLKGKSTDNIFSDVVYPIDLDLSNYNIRFHLLTWRNSDKNVRKNFWNMISFESKNTTFPHSLEGRIMFRDKSVRNAFKKWWSSYTNRFFSGITPIDVFLPYPKPGKLQGHFVEHVSMMDNLPYNYQLTTLSIPSLSHGLLEILPAWSWISANCKKPVYKMSGGWLFNSATDATNFILFDGKRSTT